MAWAGSVVLLTVRVGVLGSQAFGKNPVNMTAELNFVQISYNHNRIEQAGESGWFRNTAATIDKFPARHDIAVDAARQYLEGFGKGSRRTRVQLSIKKAFMPSA